MGYNGEMKSFLIEQINQMKILEGDTKSDFRNKTWYRILIPALGELRLRVTETPHYAEPSWSLILYHNYKSSGQHIIRYGDFDNALFNAISMLLPGNEELHAKFRDAYSERCRSAIQTFLGNRLISEEV